MLNIESGLFNLLIYLTDICDEVKFRDQKTLLKQRPDTDLALAYRLFYYDMDTEIKHLYVDSSSIPSSGKGLFTSKDIEKGELIIEYTGEITTWEEVRHDATNVYIYFVNEDYAINAKNFPDAIARYANDAHGLKRVDGLHNNSRFVNIEGKIFIKARKLIRAGSEILVEYGKDYWDTVKRNKELLNQK